MTYTNGKTNNTLLNGRYKILRELGKGGFGVTYLALDTNADNSYCAIKKLNPLSADVEAAKKLFYREAKILEILQNTQQIPKFIDYFEAENNFYLVEEYVEGVPLTRMIAEKWSRKDVISLLQQILSILNILHQQNIVHRDINPSNIIKTKEKNQFVLIDFGAVKQLEPNQSPEQQKPIYSTLIITKGYSPPEQSEGRVGFYSDIYALGITVIQLLTGIHPTALQRDENGNVILPDLDDWLANILQKMVSDKPEQRYQSVNEVLSDLTKTELSITKELNSGFKKHKKSNNIQGKFKYVVTVLTGVIAIAIITAIIEWTNPFIRPLYYLYEGNKFLDKWQAKAALEEFDQVIKIRPKSVAGWKGRGDALFVLRRYDGALASYNKAIDLQPQDIQTRSKILVNQGRILYYKGEYQKALENYENILDINPEEVEAWSGKGLAQLGLHKYSEAEISFKKVKDIKPNDPKIWQEIAFATQNLKGWEAAKKYFEEALEIYTFFLKKNPKDVISWTDKGAVLLKLNRPQEALDSFEQALKVDQNFYEALIGKGNALTILGKYQDARSAFDSAIKNNPKDYQVWYNRGLLMLQNIKDYKEALKSFNKSIEYKNDFYHAWVGKGLTLLQMKDNQHDLNEALAAFDKAKDLNPNDPYIWDYRAEALKQLGKMKEAQESEQKAKKLRLSLE
jgi:tetratricopeptide (TPR) repeat protein/predicted Ser/Thr protein kinase